MATIEAVMRRRANRLVSLSNVVTARQFRVLQLLYVDGLTQAEAAARLSLAQQVVGRHHSRALRRLRRHPGFVNDLSVSYEGWV